MYIILWDYESVWPKVWPQNKRSHYDLYFMAQWFCLVSWRPFDVWTSFFGIMIQDDPTFDLKINVGHCDLYFMVKWFCLIYWRLFAVWTQLIGIMSQHDPKFDFKLNIGHCDLYFMVQWFCLISWRLFDVRTSLSGIMSIWPDVWPQNKYTVTYTSWSSDFALHHCHRVIDLNYFYTLRNGVGRGYSFLPGTCSNSEICYDTLGSIATFIVS